jgi:hypothetical protein
MFSKSILANGGIAMAHFTRKSAGDWWNSASEEMRLTVCRNARIKDVCAKCYWPSVEEYHKEPIVNALNTYAVPQARVQE